MTTANTDLLVAHSPIGSERLRPLVVHDPLLNFVTPQLKRLLAVWNAKREARRFPNRDEFGLRDLSFVLPNLAFIDLAYEGSQQRYLVRLMGGQLDSYVGPMTGKFIDEALPPHFATKWGSIWQRAVETKEAQRSIGQVEIEGRHLHIFEKFCAPLGSDGGPPTMIIVATFFHAIPMAEDGIRNDISARLLKEIDGAAMPEA
jgi:hypothetical protein